MHLNFSKTYFKADIECFEAIVFFTVILFRFPFYTASAV